MTSWRAAGGQIDRERPLRFTFDGTAYGGFTGDTLASALLAAGVHHIGHSVNLGRPRGIVSAGAEEPSALVRVDSGHPEPMVPAPVVELYDGLVASGLSGRGRLPAGADPARYDGVYAHCDLLVIGAGPAGLSAAHAAASAGARVILADERPEPGGSLLAELSTVELERWRAAVLADLTAAGDVRVLTRTTMVGYYDHNYVVGLQRRIHHLGPSADPAMARERLWRIRARRVVLATGAHERWLAFADNDRPGIMLAGAARAYLHRYGVLAGSRAVVFTTNDAAYEAARDLGAAGVDIAAVVDVRPHATEHLDGVRVLRGHGVTATIGTYRVSAVDVSPLDGGAAIRFDADLLLVSGGFSPVLHLYSQAGGRLRYDPERVALIPDGCRQAVEVAGAAHGVPTTGDCRADGAEAARRSLAAIGWGAPRGDTPQPAEVRHRTPPAEFWSVPATVYESHFVDLQRDVTVADVLRATGTGMRSVEHVKRYTTAGTGAEQGKLSGVLASGVIAEALGVPIGDVGMPTLRPPYTPVSFAALAGRDRGHRFDPVRVTPMHDWHVANGAVFENVGQWKRPWWYPHDGEDMAAAVLRECRAARERVACMDVSTLGIIEVSGVDAASFLDLVYTNVMSTLPVGAIRYGVMCRTDGMVFDDGTVARLEPERFHLTTTTGNAGPVLDWLEEWLQTEWPHLRVWCTSVTDQWATVALVGPHSRRVLAMLAPELAVDAASFPFMTWRETVVAGLPARVCRISFSGELAYELNVSAWHGLALWEAVLSAGAVPYGTETMHVLRAEKGYPIIGQDTDGTVTPQDLGLGWAVAMRKPDFIGKRSFARPDTARTDRKQLVGLLPENPSLVLPEGVHVLDTPTPGAPPVAALGHVTSSYRSAALGRGFALALLASGRQRIGQTVWALLESGTVPVTVAGPVLYDPEGARRDG